MRYRKDETATSARYRHSWLSIFFRPCAVFADRNVTRVCSQAAAPVSKKAIGNGLPDDDSRIDQGLPAPGAVAVVLDIAIAVFEFRRGHLVLRISEGFRSATSFIRNGLSIFSGRGRHGHSSCSIVSLYLDALTLMRLRWRLQFYLLGLRDLQSFALRCFEASQLCHLGAMLENLCAGPKTDPR